MCLAQGPQRSDAGEAQTHAFGLESSTLPLSHCADHTSFRDEMTEMYHKSISFPTHKFYSLRMLWASLQQNLSSGFSTK